MRSWGVDRMILIALGGNLETREFGTSLDALRASLEILKERGVGIAKLSPWYRTAPVPVSSQPCYVNAVAQLDASPPGEALLEMLHAVEARMGRERGKRWAARTVDLDLLAHGERIRRADDRSPLELPHPRLQDRAFVLRPLLDVAPDWRHPVLGRTARELYHALPEEARAGIEPLAD